LVIIDGLMPAMDGFGLVGEIRKNPALDGASVMMLSSDRQSGDAVRCKSLGVASYIVKPIVAAELLKAVLSVLSERGIIPAATEAKEAHKNSIGEAPVREAEIRNLLILLAEDNAVNQKLAIRLLEKMGHRVLLAKNGREAVETVKTAEPGTI